MTMRSDCRHYESRTYASGEAVRKCILDLAPEAPWNCPADCPRYERRRAVARVVGAAGRSGAEQVGERPFLVFPVAVRLWSATSLFVRAGHAAALMLTAWRVWLALPPLSALVYLGSPRSDSAALWPD